MTSDRADRQPDPTWRLSSFTGEGRQGRRDILALIASRMSSRVGDGFLRILAVLLVAARSKDPMIAGLVLVFRYVAEVLINAVSGPFIDRWQIRRSLMAAELLRSVLAGLMVAAVVGGRSSAALLVLSFLGDFVFIFFKPAADKVVKVSVPTSEGTTVLSLVDASNHVSNIGGYALASLVAVWLGADVAVWFGPFFFFISFLMVSRLRLPGERVIDYGQVRSKNWWASQREGLRYTWASPPLRLLLIGRSLVAVGQGSFSVLAIAYLAHLTNGLSSYGYFESAQSAGKVAATLVVIPLLFPRRSTFLLTGVSLLAVGVSFFGFNMVASVVLACLVGALTGAGQASQAVGVDAIINKYADAHIQGRAKSTTSFGSRLSGLVAIGVVYFLVTAWGIPARVLFGWLGVVPLIAGCVFLLGWRSEIAERAPACEVVDEV